MTPTPTPAAPSAPAFDVVALTALRASPHNARRHIDKAAMKDLVESVKTKGVLEPILVRPIDGHFEVVAGYRRWKAAEAAELSTIPAVIRTMDETEALELSLIENLQRADIHPLDEALGYRALLERAKYDVPGLAVRIGKSTSYVYQRLKLADLIKPAQAAFLEDRFQAGHAILLARLQPKDQERALKDALFDRYGDAAGAARPVRALVRWIEEEIHLDLQAAAFRKDDETLVPAAGACMACPKRTGTNPALFPDIKKGDVCTDPACFHAKLRALSDRRVAELEVDGQPVKRISTRSYIPPQEMTRLRKDGVLMASAHHAPRAGEWRDAGKATCPDTVFAVVVDSESGGIGQLRKVCANPAKCRVHTDRLDRGLSADSARSQTRQKAGEETRRIERTVRATILEAILKAPARPIAERQLDLVARALTDRLGHEEEKTLCALLGLKVGKDYGATGLAIRKLVKKAAHKPAERVRFLLAAALAPTVDPAYGSFGSRLVARQDLETVAGWYGVKPAVIGKPIRAAARIKAAAAAKRARTKTTVVRKAARAKRPVRSVAMQTSAHRKPRSTKQAKETAA